MKPFDIIATVSDRVTTRAYLDGFLQRGVTILRINGAHTDAARARRCIDTIRSAVGRRAKIMIDLPGNKVRTANIRKPMVLRGRQSVTLTAAHFNHPEFLAQVRPGQVLLANDGRLQLQVDACDAREARCTSRFDGVLENNKGVHVDGGVQLRLPFLFERDLELIEVATAQAVEFVGLSFIRSPEDIRDVRRRLQGSAVDLICKIETREACEHLEAIVALTGQVLIDRGDLSGSIGFYELPRMEHLIATFAGHRDVGVFVATQLLYNMVASPTPLMAEVMSLYHVLRYADGIQLSDETAVGRYPLEALDVIQRLRAQMARGRDELLVSEGSWLVPAT